MAFSGNTKYIIEYLDVEGIQHITEIEINGYFGDATYVQGNVILSYVDTDNPSETIRGSGLTINLEANPDLTFSDLITDSERDVRVKYSRAGIRLFWGWLNADGFFEDFVKTDWIVSLECVNGLGYLDNLAYVDDNGLFFTGKQSQLEIIFNCLDRTGLPSGLNTRIEIFYTGLATNVDPLANVYLNADRFYKDDGTTIMSCKEVLEDVLRPYNAFITYFENSFWVISMNALAGSATPTYYLYDSRGVSLGTEIYSNSINIDSQIINSTGLYHVNSNQQIRYVKAIGAVRIRYKYGLVKSLVDNFLLQNVAGAIADYTIDDATKITFPATNYGIILNPVDSTLALHSNNITLTANDNFKFRSIFRLNENAVDFKAKVRLTNGGTHYYMKNNGSWTTVDTFINYLDSVPNGGVGNDFNGSGFEITLEIQSDDLPINGNVYIELYTPDIDPITAFPVYTGNCTITEVSLEPTVTGDDKQGEFHTLERDTKPTSRVLDVIDVNVGDTPTDLYYGTIYKADQTTPTETWFRLGVAEAKAILELMGESILAISQYTASVFSGDVYGYVPYIYDINIVGVDGFFIPIKYVYDTKNNITQLTSISYFSNTTGSNYTLTYDYGNTVKPTIKG